MLAILETIDEENRMLVAKGRRLGRKEGKEEGLKEGIRQTAKKMLEENISIEKIVKITGLNKKEIEKMSEKSKKNK